MWGGGKKERGEANHKRLLTVENKLKIDGGKCSGNGLDGL